MFHLLFGIIAGLGLFSPTQALADCHKLETIFNPGDWAVSVQVEGRESKFYQEGHVNNSYRILYTAPEKVKITLMVEYVGSLPPGTFPMGVQLEVHGSVKHEPWVIDGNTATLELDMRAETNMNTGIGLGGEFNITTSDPLISPSCSFYGALDIYKPLSVSIYTGGGNLLFGKAYRVIPAIVTDGPNTWIGEQDVAEPDVSFRFESDGVAVIGDTSWMTTDDSGMVKTTLNAPTTTATDDAGLVRVKVGYKVVKHAFKDEGNCNLSLSFAMVIAANGAQLVGHEGAIMDPVPLWNGDHLKPGDIVQVGNDMATTAMNLQIEFCDGQVALLQSETYSGVRATVSSGGLGAARSVLMMTLKNTANSVANDPRRYGRLVIAKVLGNAIDGAIGIPDPVGWSVTTPGGAVENWLVEYSENLYRGAPIQAKPNNSTDTLDVPSCPWASAYVDVYSDGTTLVYNRGTAFRVSGPGGSCVVPRNGAVMVNNAVSNSIPSSVGLAPPPTPGTPLVVGLTPANGAVAVSRTPRVMVTISSSSDNPPVPGSFICRLDGRLLSSFMVLDNSSASYQLGPDESLLPGPHLLEAEVLAADGSQATAVSTFTVGEAVKSPAVVEALAGRTNVVVRWDTLGSAAGGFHVYRSADGTNFLLRSDTNKLYEKVYVDSAPLPHASYAVTAVSESGSESSRVVVSVIFPGFQTEPPPAITNLSVLSGSEDLLVAWETVGAVAALWRVERGTTATGPFADLLGGARIAARQWLDQTASATTNYWYRITPFSVDGIPGTPSLAGPAAWTNVIVPITGLVAAYRTNGAVQLSWNHYDAAPAIHYRIYRSDGIEQKLVATVLANTNAFLDTGLPGGTNYRWNVTAELAGTVETPQSPTVSAGWMAEPAAPGLIQFVTDTYRGSEGNKVIIPIIRTGGSDGPAFVRYSTLWTSATATYDLDFLTAAGTLIFNSGETQKLVEVQLLRDSVYEFPEEFFTLELRSVTGGPGTGPTNSTRIYLAEPDVFSWQTTWYSTTEGVDPSVSLWVVRSNPSTNVVSVDYYMDTDNTTATPGLDFVPVPNGTLVFQPGETSKCFTVSIIDDSVKESNEAIRFRLQNPQGGASIDQSDPWALIATVDIQDDDTRPGRLVFATNQMTVREGQDAQLPIQRLDGSDGSLFAFVSFAGGSADPNTDLGPLNMLIFNEGETQKVLTLPVLADGIIEGRESAVLSIMGQSMGGGGNQGPPVPSSMLLVIEDDPPTACGFTNWSNAALSGVAPAERAATADPDHDGIPNWVEYIQGSNPVQSNSPPVCQLEFNNFGQAQVALSLPDDGSFTVTVEFSTDLSGANVYTTGGTWAAPVDHRRQVLFTDSWANQPMRFIRVRYYWLEP